MGAIDLQWDKVSKAKRFNEIESTRKRSFGSRREL